MDFDPYQVLEEQLYQVRVSASLPVFELAVRLEPALEPEVQLAEELELPAAVDPLLVVVVLVDRPIKSPPCRKSNIFI